MDDLDEMTGLQSGGSKALVLDMLSLNGDAEIKEVAPGEFKAAGGFYRLLKLKDAKKDVKPDAEKLGESVKVVFLKIRRALQQRSSDGKLVLWTSEHNTADDIVELHKQGVQEVRIGSARILREKYAGLRTIQYVYGLLFRTPTSEPELVKMRFKGSALGSDSKAEGVKTFYDYIYEERKDAEGNKEHLRHYFTVLGAAKEEGKKTYFTVTFERGDKLPQEWCDLADTTLREVHTQLVAVDEARIKRINALKESGEQVVQQPVKDPLEDEMNKTGGDTVAYPEEEINPEDIPF